MANTDVRNIVVGAANVFFSASTTNYGGRPSDPVFTSGVSAASYLNTTAAWNPGSGSGSWINAGLTSEGVDLSYEPNYGEVMVDQLLDVAKIFKQSLKVTAKTTLSEATLANLEVAFGNEQTTTAWSSASSTVQLSLPAGALGAEPVERSLVFVSQSAPGGSQNAWGSGSANAASAGNQTERVYVARRVVSMDTVAHSLKRDAATVFPVTFRLLPDTAFAGSEYGKIIDRVYVGSVPYQA
jgi:hypothetical protein